MALGIGAFASRDLIPALAAVFLGREAARLGPATLGFSEWTIGREFGTRPGRIWYRNVLEDLASVTAMFVF